MDLNQLQSACQLSRRNFLFQSLWGVGAVTMADLLKTEGLAQDSSPRLDSDPLAARKPHFAARAKHCIYIYLEGGPSQMDLYDPKPTLNRLDGQPLPESLLKNMQFAFLQKETARIMGTPRKFAKHGECGMDFSDLLPHLATCADDLCMIRSVHSDQFNHVPAQLLMNCGSAIAGRPSLGSWLCYGLGSESQDLPAYVSLVTTGRGIPGGSASWSSGFLPSSYSGVLFGNEGETVNNIRNPAGITPQLQKSSVDFINNLNRLRTADTGDSELASRIKAYELAFRLQSSTPELTDLSGETQATLDMYGFDRDEPKIKSNRGGKGLFRAFAYNCLLARRMIERGVRTVNVIHSSWDHHSRLDPELAHNCEMADQPIAALIKDLKQRGLLEDTLVIIGSEFGRTPLGENRPGYKKVTGRDHHPGAFTVLMAGGGIKPGCIFGESDEIGWSVQQNPVHVHDLHATVLHLFGLDHTRLTHRVQGRDFRLTDVAGRVVQEIIS
ncbi:DUF1501 domain-containing protein [Blastopirellula sp. J2-11]|uniref:DUF1501 domain-containing protein n=1 Tax=Blastopirellula sp. J2-11 TaxID=2943192 RepID=UPI0021C5CF73|nr:DUF1501 domain-containing protein [Blastopirellula sp. J2-11]UUO06434.1 DUF1501 domain-containing protein [Blastopirellula sp. J2-11]